MAQTNKHLLLYEPDAFTAAYVTPSAIYGLVIQAPLIFELLWSILNDRYKNNNLTCYVY